MSATNIALNRFGLGARPDEPLPGDPKRWLVEQFGRFDPKPPAIASAPGSAAVSAELADYISQQQTLRQQAQSAGGPQGARGAQAAPAPAMAQEMPGMERPGAAPQPLPPGMAAPGMMPAPGTAAPGPRPKPPRSDAQMELRQFVGKEVRQDYSALVAARATAAFTTETPFVERMVHFWSNHFAISVDKLQVIGLGGTLEFEAIRPHVLGSFRDMLTAVERHPAMLLYLDQAVSVGPNSVLGQRVAMNGKRKVGLNENLAREILELHTLGVRTGYSQADVTEFARALTGWTVAGIGQGPGARLAGTIGQPGQFVFAGPIHEPGDRTIMGKRYREGGYEQGQAVLNDIAVAPATAQHLATKLARHFAGDTPPPAMVARLQAAFLRSGGDLPTVYRAIIDSPEAWVEQSPKFKTPWEWTVSTYRALGARDVQPGVIIGLMNQLGQPVWKPGQPVGYDDVAGSWAAPDAVMRRVEAAERFASRSPASIDARALAPKLFPASVSAATSQWLDRAESPAQALALLLVSPEMMRR